MTYSERKQRTAGGLRPPKSQSREQIPVPRAAVSPPTPRHRGHARPACTAACGGVAAEARWEGPGLSERVGPHCLGWRSCGGSSEARGPGPYLRLSRLRKSRSAGCTSCCPLRTPGTRLAPAASPSCRHSRTSAQRGAQVRPGRATGGARPPTPSFGAPRFSWRTAHLCGTRRPCRKPAYTTCPGSQHSSTPTSH